MRELARALALALPLLLVLAPAAVAQTEENFTASHLQAAADLIRATGGDATFDDILPDVATRTQTVFTRTNPALTREIEVAVNAAAIEMVPRRLELALVLQQIWARRYTEEELRELTAFFRSPLGAKYIENLTTINVLALGASRQYQETLSADMVVVTRRKLQEAGHAL